MRQRILQKERGSISMTLLVRDLPADERPRERLLAEGAASLSNTELLAVLLRTGVKDDSVLRVAEKVLALYKERGLAAITQMSAKELSSIKGVGMAKAATILAAVELGRRLALKAAEERTIVHGPADAAVHGRLARRGGRRRVAGRAARLAVRRSRASATHRLRPQAARRPHT